jgi:hypothetical protein
MGFAKRKFCIGSNGVLASFRGFIAGDMLPKDISPFRG